MSYLGSQSLAETLDDHGHALPASYAHGLKSEGLVGGLEAVEQRGHDAGTRHAEWVAKSNRTTIDVEFIPRDVEIPGRRDHLCSECFVDLYQVYVVDGHTCAGQRLPTRSDRAQSHDLRVECRYAA